LGSGRESEPPPKTEKKGREVDLHPRKTRKQYGGEGEETLLRSKKEKSPMQDQKGGGQENAAKEGKNQLLKR